MKYLLMIYDREQIWLDMPADERDAMHAEYIAFTADLKKTGHWLAGDALQPIHTATTVRVRDGKTATTDGPFAETREQLGGFYMIEAKDLDEATAIAARIPSVRIGSVEVRPIVDYGNRPALP